MATALTKEGSGLCGNSYKDGTGRGDNCQIHDDGHVLLRGLQVPEKRKRGPRVRCRSLTLSSALRDAWKGWATSRALAPSAAVGGLRRAWISKGHAPLPPEVMG